MLKAETLLNAVKIKDYISSNITSGTYIVWPLYNGKNILTARKIENYVTTFFKSGTKMPIPSLDLGLDIESIETEYDDKHNNHCVVIKGFVVKNNLYLKGEITMREVYELDKEVPLEIVEKISRVEHIDKVSLIDKKKIVISIKPGVLLIEAMLAANDIYEILNFVSIKILKKRPPLKGE